MATAFSFNVSQKQLKGEEKRVWRFDANYRSLYDSIYDKTLVSPSRGYQLYQWTQYATTLRGPLIHVGVYQGGSAKITASAKTPDKPLYLFDTFTGLPHAAPTMDFFKKGTFKDTSKEQVQRLLSEHENTHIIKGIFPASAPESISPPFALAYIDVDQYRSCFEALKYLYPRMQQGAPMLFDDYNWKHAPGIKSSIEDYRKEVPSLPPLIITTRYQGLLLKQ